MKPLFSRLSTTRSSARLRNGVMEGVVGILCRASPEATSSEFVVFTTEPSSCTKEFLAEEADNNVLMPVAGINIACMCARRRVYVRVREYTWKQICVWRACLCVRMYTCVYGSVLANRTLRAAYVSAH